jgi:hypothetical protein
VRVRMEGKRPDSDREDLRGDSGADVGVRIRLALARTFCDDDFVTKSDVI